MIDRTKTNGQRPGDVRHSDVPPAPTGRVIGEAEYLELIGAECVWAFSANRGWSRVPDPAPWGASDDYQSRMHRAGFWLVDDFGVGRVTLTLWENFKSGAYLAVVSVVDDGETVLLPTLPDRVAFLGLVLPMLQANAALEVAEAQAARELDAARRRRKVARRGG